MKHTATPASPSGASAQRHASSDGARPKEITSASESNCSPNADCVRVSRATRPSMMSKNIAKTSSSAAVR